MSHVATNKRLMMHDSVRSRVLLLAWILEKGRLFVTGFETMSSSSSSSSSISYLIGLRPIFGVFLVWTG